MKTTQIQNKHSNERAHNLPVGGLPVHTHLRAGLSWDNLDDQATALWCKLASAASNATSALTSGGTTGAK